MAHSPAYERFVRSQQIGYDQWHDGVGYDLDAFAQMTPQERDAVAAATRANPKPDWRDMEVLGAHGGRASLERLRHLLAEGSARSRAWALGVLIDAGQMPGSVADVQLAHIILSTSLKMRTTSRPRSTWRPNTPDRCRSSRCSAARETGRASRFISPRRCLTSPA